MSQNFVQMSLQKRVSIGSALVGLLLLLALHVLEPEINPTWVFISLYSSGKYGYLMNITFFTFAVSLMAFAISLYPHWKKWNLKIGIILLVVSAVGMLLASLFNADPMNTPQEKTSFDGVMHMVGGQLNLTPFAALFVAMGLRRILSLQSFVLQWILVFMVFIMVAGFIATAAMANGVFQEGVYTALFGRGMITIYFIWQIYVIVFQKKEPL
jgi:hypothetical protein